MDPVEQIVSDALDKAGIAYLIDGKGDTCGLDFLLCGLDTFIECKRFHTERTSEQMARVENVIVIQGIQAAHVFAELITNNVNT